MIRKTGKDRLSPPLMNAFRAAHAERSFLSRGAEGGGNGAGGKPPQRAGRAAFRAPITEQALREDVARDLAALVNTTSLESAVDLSDFEAVRGSILNYGIRDLNSRFADQAGNGALARDVEAALARYEPRLAPGTVSVRQRVRVDEPSLTVRLEISAELRCAPVNIPVVFVADIDVDSCSIAINRAGQS